MLLCVARLTLNRIDTKRMSWNNSNSVEFSSTTDEIPTEDSLETTLMNYPWLTPLITKIVSLLISTCRLSGRVLNDIKWGNVVKWEFIAGPTFTDRMRFQFVADPRDNKFNYFPQILLVCECLAMSSFSHPPTAQLMKRKLIAADNARNVIFCVGWLILWHISHVVGNKNHLEKAALCALDSN